MIVQIMHVVKGYWKEKWRLFTFAGVNLAGALKAHYYSGGVA